MSRVAGTPDYISPEHARGRPAGPPADLYAFGVLCFHMLTGQLPFIGTTPMEVMEKHVHSPAPIPHEINKEIPKALSELILKLLAKEPGDRPDAQQVKADLRAATKQMRNATTQMSLMSIEPVVEGAPGDEKRRARELAVSAQVADLKRKVTRRWPFVLGGVVSLWLIGVLAYVLWPAPIQPVQPASLKKPPPKSDVPMQNPMLVRADPVQPRQVDPIDVKKDPVIVPVGNDNPPQVTDEVDAGEPVIDEDRDRVLDDVAIGEKKRNKRIDVTLDDMLSVMKQDTERAEYYEKAVSRVKKVCDEANTLRHLDNCEDELLKLSERFYK